MLYFDIKRENELIGNDGSHFWCEACVVARPLYDKSPDPRYCLGCYGVLSHEAEMQPTRRAAWMPKNMSHETTPEATQTAPEGQGVVAKVVQPTIPSITEKQGIMQHHGRPRKEGEVHRTTEWRRQKQGALL